MPRRRVATDKVTNGSLHYLAPELLRPRGEDAIQQTNKCDMWALGCILYALLTGRLPFTDGFLPRLQMHIVEGRYERLGGEVSHDARECVEALLETRIRERWGCDEVSNCVWLK